MKNKNEGTNSNYKLLRGKVIYSLQNDVNLLKIIIVIIKGTPDIKRAACIPCPPLPLSAQVRRH